MNSVIPYHKAAVDQEHLILFVYPDCGFSKNISAKKIRHRQRILYVKCKCGHSFKVKLELRLRIRKATDLEGLCKFSRPGTGSWKVILLDLSIGGVGFELRGKHGLKIGDKGTIQFTLDNRLMQPNSSPPITLPTSLIPPQQA